MQPFDGAGHYVEGPLRLLQYVEAWRPIGRRFGADPDARWSSFRGDLETVDRIELMIRDADAEWPGGFTVFRLIPLSAATACMLSTAPYGPSSPAGASFRHRSAYDCSRAVATLE